MGMVRCALPCAGLLRGLRGRLSLLELDGMMVTVTRRGDTHTFVCMDRLGRGWLAYQQVYWVVRTTVNTRLGAPAPQFPAFFRVCIYFRLARSKRGNVWDSVCNSNELRTVTMNC